MKRPVIWRCPLPALCALWLALVSPGALSPASAGLGPENVCVVVNRTSWASQTVANHYIAIRQIPVSNVVYLDWTRGTDTIDVDTFRKEILGPVLMEIERRGLSDQIDAISYSSDFPYEINLTGDLGEQTPPKQLSPFASITSATYLWQLVMTRNPNVISLGNNQYTRSAGKRVTDPATHGFRSWYGWGPNGEIIEAGGIHYMLSTMLAVTSGRGNSISEVVGYLRTSAKADGTRPAGTIYYCATDDIRSKTRAYGFEAAVADLKQLGVKAEIVTTALPTGKADVAGLMAGVATFNWPSAQSKMLPGALCEHLTSFGGTMVENASQTPLTEFLRYGAAGASGTVVEPYAMQDKFPLPAVQVHYARGCSLAEAFYQSLLGPYQLLIVGDPLCQPWARIPQVQIEGVTADETLSGKVNVQAQAKVEGGTVDRLQMFVDGRRVARRPAGTALPLDTTTQVDGWHELRVVALDASPIETQGRAILPFKIDNTGARVELTLPETTVRWESPVKASIKAPGLEGVMLFANGRSIGQVKGAEGEVTINPRELGTGPVQLSVVGVPPKGRGVPVISAPILLDVKPYEPLPALPQTSLVQGLLLKSLDGPAIPIHDTRPADWLSKAGVKAGEAYGIDAYFDIPRPARSTIATAAADVEQNGLYQFQIWYTGDLKVAVDKKLLYSGKDGDFGQVYVPVALAPGLHRLRISGRAGDDVKLRIRFGGEGTRSLDGKTFRHPSVE